MDISRKTDYALRMMAELVRAQGTTISVRTVADNNAIPYSFARSIQHDLVRNGVIDSERGSHGGMRLTKDPHTITVGQIIEAIQGPIFVSQCSVRDDGKPCPFRPECNYNPMWCEAERMMRNYFNSATLYDVVVERKHPILSKGNEFVLVGPQAPLPTDVPSAQ